MPDAQPPADEVDILVTEFDQFPAPHAGVEQQVENGAVYRVWR